MTVTVPSLPEPVPTSTDPTNFDERADALLSALPAVVAAQNLQNVENNTLNAAVVLQAAAAAADRVQTGLDRAAAALSKTGSAADKVATAEDRAQTALDRLAASTKAAEAAASAASALAHKNAAATSEVNSATSATDAETARVAALAASTTAVDVVAAASAAIEGASAIEANVLASQTSSEAAWAAMLTAINYLATAQELLSVPSTNLAINILGSAIMKSGSVFYSVEYGVPATYMAYTGGVAQWEIAATNVTTGDTAIYSKRTNPGPSALRVKGKASITGGRSTESVFVEPGAKVSFLGAGSGLDIAYLQGNFADYNLVCSASRESITASRIIASGEVESVAMSMMPGVNSDRLTFKDGSLIMNNSASWGVVPTAANLDTSLVAPATFPADAILVDTNSPTDVLLCNGAAVSRTDYPFLFARIGTRFGVGDGSTTFNLPTIPSLATGVPAYIKA